MVKHNIKTNKLPWKTFVDTITDEQVAALVDERFEVDKQYMTPAGNIAMARQSNKPRSASAQRNFLKANCVRTAKGMLR